MGSGIKISTRSEQHDVGLELRVLRQTQRVLDVDDGSLAHAAGQETNQAPHAARVADSDRHHFHDLPGNELDPIVFAEDASLGHLVILCHAEAVPLHLYQASRAQSRARATARCQPA